jgi:hypothetical protein
LEPPKESRFMTINDAPPIACTLAPRAYKDRLGWIAALNKDALLHHERHDLVLDLRYAAQARDHVREMVRNEQACCGFLAFDLRETGDETRLTITAPETARDAADILFEQFATDTPASLACGCASPEANSGSQRPPGAKAAGVAAATIAAGAVACGACCVLPFALPAAVLAGSGGILAWFAGMHGWVSALAVLAVGGAWGWIARQTRRLQCRPAASTLWVMATATALTVVALLWPWIEQPLARLFIL